ncbi:MAG: hypothetical protein QOH84_622 [Kribbellaceae bacterium]|jgi:hypothetical protein|nr:hypothetical protein [Kribbellaceae bacterium]
MEKITTDNPPTPNADEEDPQSLSARLKLHQGGDYWDWLAS